MWLLVAIWNCQIAVSNLEIKIKKSNYSLYVVYKKKEVMKISYDRQLSEYCGEVLIPCQKLQIEIFGAAEWKAIVFFFFFASYDNFKEMNIFCMEKKD